ncbi:MAG: AMP-binding protein, partial [bacterium]|nr:AMP-binding protein [bacterium]
FVHILKTRRVSRIVLVPGLLYRFFDDDTRYYKELPELTFWVSSGEALRPDFPGMFRESKVDSILLNLYGSSEVSADVTYFDTASHTAGPGNNGLSSVPIGSPIHNTKIYILNKEQNPVPIGVSGEIYIGGAGLAAGYLNQPELTREKFDHDFKDWKDGHDFKKRKKEPSTKFAVKLYKTGDLGRWLEDGNIEFLGRGDQQVKIRGFRIELGEIEYQLASAEDVAEVVVTERTDKSGDNYLCAYIIPSAREGDADEPIDISKLKEHLSGTLPYYMVPSHFVLLETFPLTSTGKIDRKALPEPGIQTGDNYAAPVDHIEQQLVEIWREVLGIGDEEGQPAIGTRDDFFRLGGHSLRGTVLVSRIHKVFHVNVPLAQLFANPTIHGLKEYIIQSKQERYASIEPAEKREYYRLSPSQKRMYILQQMETGGTGYNMPFAFPLGKEFDGERLERIFKQLIRRHDSLRTSFHMIGLEPVQKVHREVDFRLEYIEAGSTPLKEVFIRPFDLSSAPLFRVGVVDNGKGGRRLLCDTHHIISDGSSQTVLEKEFAALSEGKDLEPLRLQYKDYSQWQNSEDRQVVMKMREKYWLDQFPDELPVLHLPLDFSRPLMQSFAG